MFDYLVFPSQYVDIKSPKLLISQNSSWLRRTVVEDFELGSRARHEAKLRESSGALSGFRRTRKSARCVMGGDFEAEDIVARFGSSLQRVQGRRQGVADSATRTGQFEASASLRKV